MSSNRGNKRHIAECIDLSIGDTSDDMQEVDEADSRTSKPALYHSKTASEVEFCAYGSPKRHRTSNSGQSNNGQCHSATSSNFGHSAPVSNKDSRLIDLSFFSSRSFSDHDSSPTVRRVRQKILPSPEFESSSESEDCAYVKNPSKRQPAEPVGVQAFAVEIGKSGSVWRGINSASVTSQSQHNVSSTPKDGSTNASSASTANQPPEQVIADNLRWEAMARDEEAQEEEILLALFNSMSEDLSAEIIDSTTPFTPFSNGNSSTDPRYITGFGAVSGLGTIYTNAAGTGGVNKRIAAAARAARSTATTRAATTTTRSTAIARPTVVITTTRAVAAASVEREEEEPRVAQPTNKKRQKNKKKKESKRNKKSTCVTAAMNNPSHNTELVGQGVVASAHVAPVAHAQNPLVKKLTDLLNDHPVNTGKVLQKLKAMGWRSVSVGDVHAWVTPYGFAILNANTKANRTTFIKADWKGLSENQDYFILKDAAGIATIMALARKKYVDPPQGSDGGGGGGEMADGGWYAV